MYANFNIMSKHTHTYSKIKRICQSLINWNAMFIKLCNVKLLGSPNSVKSEGGRGIRASCRFSTTWFTKKNAESVPHWMHLLPRWPSYCHVREQFSTYDNSVKNWMENWLKDSITTIVKPRGSIWLNWNTRDKNRTFLDD